MTTSPAPALFKAPAEHPDNAEFWQAMRDGQLLVRHCNDCGKPHWYPRTLCPFCLGTTRWKPASGRGTIYSYSVTRRAGPTPFCIAYVKLDEGPTMLTQVVDCELDTVRIGQKVLLRLSPSESGTPLPTFTLA
jgi:uncharacterized OB-fold protein